MTLLARYATETATSPRLTAAEWSELCNTNAAAHRALLGEVRAAVRASGVTEVRVVRGESPNGNPGFPRPVLFGARGWACGVSLASLTDGRVLVRAPGDAWVAASATDAVREVLSGRGV